MKIENTNGVTVLTPEEGKLIVKASNPENIITGTSLFLGKEDKAENYIEIDVPKQEEPQVEQEEEKQEEAE